MSLKAKVLYVVVVLVVALTVWAQIPLAAEAIKAGLHIEGGLLLTLFYIGSFILTLFTSAFIVGVFFLLLGFFLGAAKK